MNENTVETLHFSITGEFVTKTARCWLFEEKKPYSVVEKFLLECMAGTDIPEYQLKRMAQDILLGRAEFVGSTADDTYNYVTVDGFDEKINNKIFNKLNKLQMELDKKEEELNQLTKQYLDLYDNLSRISDYEFDLDDVECYQNREILIDIAGKAGNTLTFTAPTRKTGSPLLDEFLKTNKFEDNYGFIKPNGVFVPVEWGKHVEYGEQAVKDNNWQDEFNSWYKDNPKEFHGLSFESDFIVYEKGWILLHSPAQGVATPTYNEQKGMTKAQKEFIFDYYMNRDEPQLANKYWEE